MHAPKQVLAAPAGFSQEIATQNEAAGQIKAFPAQLSVENGVITSIVCLHVMQLSVSAFLKDVFREVTLASCEGTVPASGTPSPLRRPRKNTQRQLKRNILGSTHKGTSW